jgi:hypothetical protein
VPYIGFLKLRWVSPPTNPVSYMSLFGICIVMAIEERVSSERAIVLPALNSLGRLYSCIFISNRKQITLGYLLCFLTLNSEVFVAKSSLLCQNYLQFLVTQNN